jgi:hypothetical protein
MSSSTSIILSPELVKNICEGLRCNEQATVQVTLPVGELGTIELNLCKNCVPKFTDENELGGFTKKVSACQEHGKKF